MTALHYVFFFLLALGILIAFHEYGHYLAARLCGVKVLRYCLGFGKPFISRRFGPDRTEWGIAPFPIGGYVKLLGQDSDEPVPPHEAHRAFNNQAVWKRMVIIIAGPLANFILAVAVYCGLNLYGVEEPVARVAAPLAGTPAANAGLAGGEQVTSFDGEAVLSWTDLSWRLLQAANDRRSISLETRNERNEVARRTLDLSTLGTVKLEGDFAGELGFKLYDPPPRMASAEPGSPAEQAGLKPGDVFLTANGKPLRGGRDFIQAMRANPDKPVRLEVARGNERLVVSVTPKSVEGKDKNQRFGRIGAGLTGPEMTTVSYGFAGGMRRAFSQTWEMSVFSLKMLGKMLTGDVSWRNLSGPLTIADYAGKTASLGPTYYLNFLALVSISLGVINLLPIPMLDGGHLMYYLAEIIRGKPVSERVMGIGFKFGLIVVAVSMGLALYNDIYRLLLAG
jgi:regulator of sigma E protease